MRVLTLNVANPSLARAERQLTWLGGRCDDVLVLTEVGNGPGSRLLADALSCSGYTTVFEAPPSDERGVLLASRLEVVETIPGPAYLPWRVGTLRLANSRLLVVGAYVPSRDASWGKTERKRQFVSAFCAWMRAQSGSYERLLVGDLNVVERGHMPYYPFFQEWEYAFLDTLSVCGLIDAFRLLTPSDCEYSWMDRNGDGYRYDHSFVEASAAPAVRSCSYAHATREERLSDHSAMALDVKVDAVIPSRDVQVLTSLQPSLF